MKAIQLLSHGKPGRLDLREVGNPEPGLNEAVIRVRACGLNHLDLWLEEGGLPMPVSLPRIPGCEIAGEIARLGSEVHDWKIGDRVAVQSNLFCGQCEFCVEGEESLCLAGELLGVQRDGGFAEEVLVPVRSLVRLPAEVDDLASAALTLAGSTAVHMLTQRIQVKAGDWVLVMGAASGVGSAAVQVARVQGARVLALASTEGKREMALRLGAEFAVDSSLENWPAEVRKLTGKRGVDWVVEHLGGSYLEKALQCLARGGAIVTCGATAGREIRLNLWPFFVKQHRLIGSYGRNRADLELTLEWARQGKLKPVIDRVIPLSETAQAFAALRGREIVGKAVIQV